MNKYFITFQIFQGLEELQRFMIVNGVPNKDRQKLLRNLKVRELKWHEKGRKYVAD